MKDRASGSSGIERVGRALVVLGGVLLLVWGGRLAWTGLWLRAHLAQAQALADAPDEMDPVTACALVRDLRDDVVVLYREVGGLVRLAPALGWLPRVGGDLEAAPYLMAVAGGLTEAGVLTCDALGPLLDEFQAAGGDSDGSRLERTARLLAGQRAGLEQAVAAAERAQAAWAQVDVGGLSPWLAPWLAGKVPLLERGLSLVRAGLALAVLAPDLLGMDGSRTYLILALNEDELRPGGGFIAGVGEVRLEAGRVVTMTFRDSYAVDDFTQPFPPAPEPLRRYMELYLWGFRDSNWSPDFPTAARQAVALYHPGNPGSSSVVDGVVALDQWALRGLVDRLGPLTVGGEMVTGGTVIPYIRRAWAVGEVDPNTEWWERWEQRKSFMGPLAEAAWGRLEQGQVDLSAVVPLLLRLLEERHLLVYLSQPDAAAVLAEQGWDGALRAGRGDFLMVVDANVGYNKANARVEEAIAYQVDLRQSPPQATLTLVYTHTSTADAPCRQAPRYDPVYERMMDRCYWDYVRVYVPQGSQLLDATRMRVPGEMLLSGQTESGGIRVSPAEEGPWLTFGALGVLPPSAVQTRSFTWTLPADAVQWGGEEREDGGGEQEGEEGVYFLRVQKQAGTLGHPLTVRVRLPEASVPLGAATEPAIIEGEWLIYRTTLDRDREFQVRFGRER